MTDVESRGLLMSISVRFDTLTADHELKPEEQRGARLIPLFLDDILADLCSPEVRSAFIQAFLEQAAKIKGIS